MAKDWVKIALKFNGKCEKCNNVIRSGGFAYWSRTLKKVMHSQCYENDDSSKVSDTKTLKCFICEREVNNVSFSDTDAKHEYICDICMKDHNSFLKYKDKFNEKIKRLLKAKQR